MSPGLKVVGLILGTTLFYTYVGQLVPQKRLEPPKVFEMSAELSTSDMVKIGAEIADGKGLCLTCHTIGQSGSLRFPDLAGIGARASSTREGMGDVEYLAESLYDPNVFLVEGFNPGMPVIDKKPIALTHEEILAVIAWLQSMGGTPSVTMDTKHSFNQ